MFYAIIVLFYLVLALWCIIHKLTVGFLLIFYFCVLTQGPSTEIKCECLDILCDVLHKFGNLMAADHELLLCALLPQLNSNQASVRKKTVSCIGKVY